MTDQPPHPQSAGDEENDSSAGAFPEDSVTPEPATEVTPPAPTSPAPEPTTEAGAETTYEPAETTYEPPEPPAAAVPPPPEEPVPVPPPTAEAPTASQPPPIPAAPAGAIPPPPPVSTYSGDGATGSGAPEPGSLLADRPEIAVAAAFAGGLVLALILKRLAR